MTTAEPPSSKAENPGATGAVVLRADRIRRAFGPLVAVDDLSFEAREGEIIGLLGPNGAGKTTALRVLSTILAPTAGRFTVGGISHENPAGVRRLVGVLPESAGYPHQLTGEQFLRYHARLFGHSAQSARATSEALLSEVGLADRASSVIGTYSRGMKQRLGVARALINAPRVVFLDEPTLGLDPAGQRQMLRLVKEMAAARGVAVILSTHFLDEVEEVCGRVIILHNGRVLAEGSVAEIKRTAAPATARVQVAPEAVEAAVAALRAAPGIAGVTAADGLPGGLIATFDAVWLGEHPGPRVNTAIGALAAAGVPVLSYELGGGRLTDAFLSLTGGGVP